MAEPSFLDPMCIAVGQYLCRFMFSLKPLTVSLKEFKKRINEEDVGRSVIYAPARLIDKVEESLDLYLANDPGMGQASRSAKFPVVLYGFSKDLMPTGRDYTLDIVEPVPIILPDDPKQRVFHLSQVTNDVEYQIIFFANDVQTCMAMATQFNMFVQRIENHRMNSVYHFAGQALEFPIQLDNFKIGFSNVTPEGIKNLTVYRTEGLILKVTIPIFDYPLNSSPDSDQQGDDTYDNPSGYRTVTSIENNWLTHDFTVQK